MTAPCQATLAIVVDGTEVGVVQCTLEWPHPEQDHAIAWAVAPDDLVLARLDSDLATATDRDGPEFDVNVEDTQPLAVCPWCHVPDGQPHRTLVFHPA